MASAHAKFTGQVGLCYATSGPGAIHLLNGLYDAKMDHVPVVAIVGQQARTAIGASYQQEVDLQSLFKDVAGDYRRDGERAGAGAPSDRPGRADRLHPAHRHLRHHSQRSSGADLRGPAGGPWHHPYRRRLRRPRATAGRGAAAAGGRRAQRRQEGRHAGRRRRAGRDRRGDRGRRAAAGGGRQGAAGQGRAARRSALGHGFARAAGDQAELGSDEGLRHLLHDRLRLPVQRVPAQAGRRARRADRHRRHQAEPALSDGGQHGRRQRRHPARAAAAAGAEAGRSLAARDRERRCRMVEDARGAGDGAGRSDQSAARVLGAVAAAAGELHHDRRFRLGRQLVRARHQDAPRHDGLALGRPGVAGCGHALRGGGEDGVSRTAS